MRQQKRQKATGWSHEEIAILCDVYPVQGINGAADALPDRSWGAITTMASKLRINSPVVGHARTPLLAGAQLEKAIVLREEQRWSFERIGIKFGVSEVAAQNAILIALCPRKGFTPAERDDTGRLLPEGTARLREMLSTGEKAIDIATQLGLSAGRIAEERRRFSVELASKSKPPLPPPGNGARYSGARVANDVYVQVERLLMAGHGAPRVADLTGVSRTHVLRRRSKLIARLRQNGECLPGCDIEGKRIAYKDSLASVTDGQKATLRAEILRGTAISRAARIAVVGATFAYKARDEIKIELARQGRTLPPITRLGHRAIDVDRRVNWMPAGKRNLVLYRRYLKETGGNEIEAKRRTIAALMPKPALRPEPRRPRTFEETLALIAAGKLGISNKVPLRRPDYAGTLGGVASGLL